MTPSPSPTLLALKGGLIVSCQAYPGEPMRQAETMAQLAESAAIGGAIGIRAQGLDDIALIHQRVQLPQIGLWKVGASGVFITPTFEHARAVVAAGAEIVAIDGTRRERPDGLTLAETIHRLHEETGALVMADAGSYDDGVAAAEAGADCVGTTLSGYTGEREKTVGPDLETLSRLADTLTIPVIAEGRIHTLDNARECRDAGAFAIVVGTAITHPASITRWFADSIGAR
ncbi:N-acetylmannosamine-6-phosphate 2-epimerase [Subtercola sp. PAMC28395]|uniref:N-acetylmannosamine-6-phosphate 2-epimerase n=1 Tax=Subtercola sp. PAMC28395 TaxID=2846775 RepID=UPI001C0C7466|nr:N-acetylmannosamine-6-phosphate 2-epimerase [Subtercola sp. PAMC28395]QWT24734.1 N-acetylmannosamine-6-phosphate 2-epimerase [Subtercola sp. PAMC28395]